MTDKEIVASWNSPGSDIRYTLLESWSVGSGVRKAARAGHAFACAHQGISEIALKFYAQESPAERGYRLEHGTTDWLSFKAPLQNGHADRSTKTIGVRADISPALAVEVAAHEVRHVTQRGTDREPEETDARLYGEWVRGLIVNDGKAARVHLHNRFPYDYITLAGVADKDDVLISFHGSEPEVFRNFGGKTVPLWRRHYAPCPVSVSS